MSHVPCPMPATAKEKAREKVSHGIKESSKEEAKESLEDQKAMARKAVHGILHSARAKMGKGYGRYYMDDYGYGNDQSSWSGEYFGGRLDRQEMQLHHARTGLTIDSQMRTSTSTASPHNAQPVTSTTNDNEPEEIPFGSRTTSKTTDAPHSNTTPQTKTLNFPMFRDTTTIYHQVRATHVVACLWIPVQVLASLDQRHCVTFWRTFPS